MKRIVAGTTVFVGLVAGILYYVSQRDDGAFLAIHGCVEGPLAAQAKNDGYTWPYGLVHACRVLDDSRSFFSRQETVVLLIDSERGSVMLASTTPIWTRGAGTGPRPPRSSRPAG